MKIVIRAGGVGSRLWPVSRKTNPKQFHALTGGATMLEESIERVRPVADIEDIYVSTSTAFVDTIKERHHELLPENIIAEPARRDTAAAIGLESIIIYHRDKNAVIASLGSDHNVKKPEEFQKILKVTEEFVQKHPDTIIPIGVHPTHPDTGFGYIEYGDVLDRSNGYNLMKVTRFIEKPDLKTAKEFLQKANFLWNANMFVWKAETVLRLYKKYLPEMYAQLEEIEKDLGTEKEQETIERVYPQMEKIAVDYAITEKADKVAVVSADIGWCDIGDWARLKDELEETEADNVAIGAEHVAVKTENTLVFSETPKKVIATIGVDNLVIIETDDALLVADKYHSNEVKQIVEELEKRKRDDVL
ncbi:MAG: sugar phosphate nucleotidyltransferase [Candidatus Kerfeldbacteria bacterium]